MTPFRRVCELWDPVAGPEALLAFEVNSTASSVGLPWTTVMRSAAQFKSCALKGGSARIVCQPYAYELVKAS